MSEQKDSLTLKWGSLKAWSVHTPEARELVQKWFDLGVSDSAICHHDTPEQKELVCQLIDVMDIDSVCLDWDGIWVSKEDAKTYVRLYGTAEPMPEFAAVFDPNAEEAL